MLIVRLSCCLILITTLNAYAAPQEATHILMANLDSALPSDESTGCKMKELPAPATIKDYLSFLLTTLAAADAKDQQRLQADCELDRENAKTNSKHEHLKCHVTARIVSDNGDSWNYGIKFEADRKSHNIIPGSITCPGES